MPASRPTAKIFDTGDELVIAEWDRATRSMWDGLQIIEAVIDAGAAVMVLDRSYIDLETPMGRGCMAMMSAMAEDERLRIIKRTHEGRKIAQRRRSSAGPQAEAHPAPEDGGRGNASLRASQHVTSPRLRCQRQHDFETHRMKAAAHLFRADPAGNMRRFYQPEAQRNQCISQTLVCV